MRVRTAAALAVLCAALGFALGRFSVYGGGAVMHGGRAPLALGALETREAVSAGGSPAFGRIDINTAGRDALCMLPGIGEATADRIIAHREENGPFASAEELMAVEGIGPATYEGVKDYICAGGSEP